MPSLEKHFFPPNSQKESPSEGDLNRRGERPGSACEEAGPVAAGEREAEEAGQEPGPEHRNPPPPGLGGPGQQRLSWLTRPACVLERPGHL